MGSAHMEKELMKRMVLKVRVEQNNLTEESGIESSLNEEDIMNIVKEAETDVRKQKK
jgi:hypothetical protein